MKFHFLVFLVSTFALTACAADPDMTGQEPTATVTATVTATPTPPPVDDLLAIGDKAEFKDFSVTMHSIDMDPAPESGPQPERDVAKWVSVDVEFCSHNVDGLYSSFDWSLVDAENRYYDPATTGYSSFSEPSFSLGDETIRPGECRRGWVTYEVNEDSELTSVFYEGMAFELTEGHTVRWTVDG